MLDNNQFHMSRGEMDILMSSNTVDPNWSDNASKKYGIMKMVL